MVDADRRLTYAELDRAATAVALGLLGPGVVPGPGAVSGPGLVPGDVVVVQSGNVVETVVAFYGLVRAGLVPVCALPQHGERDIADLCTISGARAHLVQADWARSDLPAAAGRLRETHGTRVLTVRGRVPGGIALEDLLDGAAPDGPALPRPDAEGLAVLQLSGGTTGTPKLIPRVHCDYVCNARAWVDRWGWDEHVVSIHALPVAHNAGIALSVLPAMLAGGTLVLAPGADAATVARMIEREGATDMVANATVAYRLLESPEADAGALRSLRRLSVGPQTPEYAARLESELGIRALGVFGMGEGLIMGTPWDAPYEVRLSTVGTPIHPLDEVRIVDVDTDDDLVDVAPGEVGELICRGPYTIPGFYAAPEHDARAFTEDGYYRTGDLARAHDVGGTTYYSIEGRIKDNVNRGGEKIHADEIERLLVTHPAVAEVAVVGMPDPELGERLCAFVVPRTGAAPPTVPDLAEFLLGLGLAKFKLPERVEIRDALPVTTVRKVAKKALREDIAAILTRERG
ncbi:pyochelin biosynthesis salicyl-AMP ligase PchD [Pseudonocardia ailaonensis]|uniref:Pyochelin biosynthesis salicyl-AMP ligase PchD n=1 Tax=Pseudonocardia ailaonensis TaxID=367279 RepID=A0ABN2MIE1_9PSEU